MNIVVYAAGLIVFQKSMGGSVIHMQVVSSFPTFFCL